MKNIYAIIVFLVAGFISARYSGIWWDIALIGFLVSLAFRLSPGMAFGSLFLGGILLWGGITWLQVLQSESTLGKDLAEVFNIGSQPLLIIIIALIGGLLASLSGWSAASLNRLIRTKKG